jgi:hypothetical protein
MPMPATVAAGWSSPQNGSVQPPKNSVTIMADDATMLEYSAQEKQREFHRAVFGVIAADQFGFRFRQIERQRLVSANDAIMKMMNDSGA